MADTGKLQTPTMNWKALDLSREWERFNKHFTYYCMGPLASKDETVKIGYLLLCVGERGRQIHENTELSEVEKVKLKANLEVFQKYTEPRKNALRAGYKFDKKYQGENELFDDFITDLRIVSKDCHFTDTDRRLRDAIVFHCYSDKVREKCLDEGDELTLEKAIEIGQVHEISQQGLKELSLKNEDPSVHMIHKKIQKKIYKKKQMNYTHQPNYAQQPNYTHQARSQHKTLFRNRCKKSGNGMCGKCGYTPSKEECPAARKQCNKCNNTWTLCSYVSHKNGSPCHGS